jgi:hypothetical protein
VWDPRASILTLEVSVAEQMPSRKRLVTVSPAKPWPEMSEEERRRFVEAVYAKMKQKSGR